MYATEELKKQAIQKSGVSNLFETKFWYNFAYTNYGGTFFDKVCIAYFRENFPDNFVSEKTGWGGENGILFNTPDDTNLVEDFREVTANYPLGYGNLEEFYCEMEWEQTEKDFKWFLEDLQGNYFVKAGTLDYLMDNYFAYYSMEANELNLHYSELEKILLEENLIFLRYGNEFLEDLLLWFSDKHLEDELKKKKNLLLERASNFDQLSNYSPSDIETVEEFFECIFSMEDYDLYVNR